MKIVLILLLWLWGLMPAGALSAPVVVPLHADWPDTLTPDFVSQLNLFPDLSGQSTVWFERKDWGGIIAHINWRRNYLEKNFERSITARRWQRWQEMASELVSGKSELLASGMLPEEFWPDELSADYLIDVPADAKKLQAWPEIPARNRELPQELQNDSGPQYPSLAGQWLVNGGVGYQHNVSSFGEYFSDMAVFHLGFAHALNNYILPCAGFTVGLGNLQSDYENLVGDGRGSNYSAMVGLMLRAPLSRRSSINITGRSGYFGRAMQWGGIFTDTETGHRIDGHTRQSGGLGFVLELGWWWQKSHTHKARFFDFNVGLMWGEADPWYDEGVDVQFSAAGNDTWLMFTFRFWDQI